MQKRDLPVTLLLDDVSRTKMKTNIADLSVLGVNIISSLREINDSLLEKSRVLVVLENAMRKGSMYSDLVLYKKVWDLRIVFIAQDEALIKSMSSVASCYTLDPTLIDYDKLYGILYNDRGVLSQYETEYGLSEISKLAKEIIYSPSASPSVKKLAEAFRSMNEILLETQEKMKNLLEEKEIEKIYLQSVEDRKNQLEEEYLKIIDTSLEMNRTLSQYQVILSRDVYEKVHVNKYQNRPRIIYIKVYEELVHMNSFLDTLFDMFRFQGRKKVKILRLYDSSASKKVLALPPHYVRIDNEFRNKEVVVNDFIYKVGGYRQILDVLLTNLSGLDILIIVDFKDHADTVISGPSLHLATCRTNKRLSRYGLDPRMTIVNDGIGELSWDHYPEYDTLFDQERFLFLSSRPVMQAIYEMEKVFIR